MPAEFVLQVLIAVATAAATAAGVYVGIKSDLTRAIVLAEKAGTSADDAHRRIDGILIHH